ncbi:MAG: hypothetical protein H6832_18555 [Planctomycetes bacterium]|nr:hypothetical protein [Planctomycetota bacterium]
MEARLAGLGLEDWEERLYAMTRGIPWLAAGADRPQCLDDVPFCREQAMALVAFEILGSVSNGGLYNIYGNGAYWMRFDYRLEAFEAIGAYEVAALIRDVDRIVGVDLTDGSYDAVEARARAVSKQLFPSEELTKFFVLTPEAYYLASRYVFENRDRIERNLPTREESRG